MPKYVRVVDEIVVEIIPQLPEGFSLEEVFHADIAAQIQLAADDIETGWTWNGTEFSAPVGPSLDDVKAARIGVILTAACAAAIVGGYQSSALGAAHLYPSSITDQINMMGSVTASLLPDLPGDWTTPFWCKDEASGQWAFRPHNAMQIQQAGADGKAHIVDCQARLEQLSAQVMAAASAQAIAAIVWEAE